MATDTQQANNRPFWAILSLVLLIAILVVIRAVDWGAADGLGTVPVSVTVRQDGELVPDVMVTLFPLAHELPLRSAAGTTGPNGRCDVTTLRFDDGAMPGPYAIGVEKVPAWSLRFHDEAFLTADPGAPPAGTAPSQIGPTARYSMAREQESKPQPGAFPAKYIDPMKSGLKANVQTSGPNDFEFEIEK